MHKVHSIKNILNNFNKFWLVRQGVLTVSFVHIIKAFLVFSTKQEQTIPNNQFFFIISALMLNRILSALITV